MTGRSAEAPCSRRISTRSTSAPAMDAPTTRMMSQGQQDGHVVGRDQLPVAEGGHHPHRALGEVEHPRGGVGHHQAGGGDGVAGTEHDPEDGVLEKVAHRTTSVPLSTTSAPSGPAPPAQDAGGVMYV